MKITNLLYEASIRDIRRKFEKESPEAVTYLKMIQRLSYGIVWTLQDKTFSIGTMNIMMQLKMLG